ncbi:site-2 protease family protein [Anaerobium acetethylicum]|uniref:Zinc metalloprotease n=1 Tax=Anaerobium acetethylicum TaxID=1619234 RepID=A0A1D3TN81_9FIRM|nr:site-2 protease family protein [Anaerobium acetethylicum]SCP94755.1 Zn-dependent protease (includes SpoIVFB) [Anaerobium acetethylicum]
MKNSFVITRIKKIQIEVNISWFLVFSLMIYTLATGYFPSVYPDLNVSSRWILGGIIALLLFGSVLLHELGHSLVSIRQGIPVKKITLFIFGGIAQIEKEPDEPVKELKIAAAGPLVSIFLFLLFMAMARLLGYIGAPEVLVIPMDYLSSANLILAGFNLIPAFPLDGGRILKSVIWYFSKDGQKATKVAAFTGSLFGFFLIFIGVFLLLNNFIVDGIWLAFIGWFINQESKSSYQSKVLTDIFDKIQVDQFMTGDVVSVDSDISIQELIENYFYKYKFNAFPVEKAGRVVGIVRGESIKRIPAEARGRTLSGSVAIPLSENLVVSPSDTVTTAMTKTAANGVGRVLVMDTEGNLLGIVSNTDILNYLRTYQQLNG